MSQMVTFSCDFCCWCYIK